MERAYYAMQKGFLKRQDLPGVPKGIEDIILQKKTLFKKEVRMSFSNDVLMYTNDGKNFYEFFSGEYIGEMRYRNDFWKGRWLYRGDAPWGNFEETGSSSPEIIQIPAQYFAERVKPYLPYKDHLAAQAKLFFYHYELAKRKEKEDKIASSLASAQREQEAQSWLDNVLEGR